MTTTTATIIIVIHLLLHRFIQSLAHNMIHKINEIRVWYCKHHNQTSSCIQKGELLYQGKDDPEAVTLKAFPSFCSPHLSSDVAHLQHQVLKTDKNAVLVCSAYTLVYRSGAYNYSRLGLHSTGSLGYYDTLVFWSYGLLVQVIDLSWWLLLVYTEEEETVWLGNYSVILRGFFFFVILVTLISRSPCCSSSKSGSQARQRYKSCSGYLFSLKRDSAHL
ncbi:hypothetical protein BD560DRAFT_494303 [Blakeslea trispora]|nr:hypothetical protein BD560DRAFT_494303 [Blakeslea trispora]